MAFSSDENSSDDEQRRFSAVCFALIGAAPINESFVGEENGASGWQSCVALEKKKDCMKILYRS